MKSDALDATLAARTKEKWRISRSVATATRRRRDRLKGQPQERQHSAAVGGTRDRLPPARCSSALARGIVTRRAETVGSASAANKARSASRTRANLVPRRFLLVDHLANIRLFAGITLARQPGAAGAAHVIVPRLIGVVLAHPTYSSARRAIRFRHEKKRAGPAPKIASISARLRLRRQFLANGSGRIPDLID
jgi:hypothetical protein